MAGKSLKPQVREGSLPEAKEDLRLENDPRFLRRVESARKALRAGRGIRLEDAKSE
jgi:hypothetical protein